MVKESNMVPKGIASTIKSFRKQLMRTSSTCSKPNIAISGIDDYKQWFRNIFQKGLQSLSSHQEERGQN